MVMAHEIAHIQHRHPIVSMSRGLTLMAVAGSITGASGSSVGQTLVNESMLLGLMKFSRDQETESDIAALRAINSLYGNVKGAEQLFTMFAELTRGQDSSAEIFLSHPHSQNRWQQLKSIANEQGWQMQGDDVALPAMFNH